MASHSRGNTDWDFGDANLMMWTYPDLETWYDGDN